MYPISEHVTESTSSGHAQVLPPFGVGRQRYLQPPFCRKQAFVTKRKGNIVIITTVSSFMSAEET